MQALAAGSDKCDFMLAWPNGPATSRATWPAQKGREVPCVMWGPGGSGPPNHPDQRKERQATFARFGVRFMWAPSIKWAWPVAYG